MNLTIGEIASACGGRLILQGTEESARVSGVVLDSRKVTKDGVFLATVGERVDGHRFIPDVFAKGVSLVICEKTPAMVEEEHGIAASGWGSYLLVENSFEALKQIAGAYRRKLQIPIVGITGSVGKTSTKEFVAGVLAEKYNVLKTDGNFNNEVGVPLTLLRITGEHEAAVVEMGISDFGEMHRLSEMVRPNIALITNIGQCHLENLKDRAGILRAKTEIFDFMDETGEVCLNGGDDMLRTVTEVHGKKPHFFGFNGEHGEEVCAENVESLGLFGSKADILVRKDGSECTFPVEIGLPGEHMVINAAAASLVGELLGLTEEQIAEGIRKVQPVGGRSNLIRLPHFTLIDDCYNANPVSMKAAISLLAQAAGAKCAILGDMFELGADEKRMHEQVGAFAAEKDLTELICVGALSENMYDAARAENAGMKIRHYAGRAELLEALKVGELTFPEGAAVLVKASHGMGFAEVVAYLKEREEA